MMAEAVMKARRQEKAMAQTAINQQLTTNHGSSGLCMRIRGGSCGEQCQDPTEWKTRETPKTTTTKRKHGPSSTSDAGGHVRRAVENLELLLLGRRLTGFI